MGTSWKSSFLISSFAIFSAGFSILNAQDPNEKSYSIQEEAISYLNLALDPNLNMRSGAESMVALHHGWSFMEDRFIGTRWFEESNIWRKSGGFLARSLKYIALDIPVDYFSIVLLHEYFGHGARYREFNFSPIDYGFSWPPPYGDGSGFASLSLNRAINYNKLLSIWTGGLEIQPLTNRFIAFRWMSTNRMHYREASMYFWSFQIYQNYVQNSVQDLESLDKLNDPQSYIRIINEYLGYSDLNNLKLTMADMQSKIRINLLNPFLYYSLYSILKTYLWDGESFNKIPTFRIGSVHYLPMLRAGLTPFGIEYQLENFFRHHKKNYLITFKLGDRTITDPWFAVGFHANNILSVGPLSFNLYGEAWQQPDLLLSRDVVFSNNKKPGIAGSLRTYYNISSTRIPTQVFFEAGYKSKGFIEAYDLSASPIISFGVGIQN